MEALERLSMPNFAVGREQVVSVKERGPYFILDTTKKSATPLEGRALFLKSGWFAYPDYYLIGEIEQVEAKQSHHLRLNRLKVRKTQV